MDVLKPKKLSQRLIKPKLLATPAVKAITQSKLTKSLTPLNPRLRKQTNISKTLRGIRK